MTGTDYLAIRYAVWLSKNFELSNGDYYKPDASWHEKDTFKTYRSEDMIELYNLFLETLKNEIF